MELTALVVLGAIWFLSFGIPKLDHTANALRPQNSPAYAALDEIKTHLVQNREPLWLITRGTDEMEIARTSGSRPARSSNGPSPIRSSAASPCPRRSGREPDYQAANRAASRNWSPNANSCAPPRWQQGFNTNSFALDRQHSEHVAGRGRTQAGLLADQ